MEATVLRRLPEILLAGTVPPAGCALLLEDALLQMLALAMIFGWWMALVPLAIFCLIIAVMKGPRPRGGAKGPMPD